MTTTMTDAYNDDMMITVMTMMTMRLAGDDDNDHDGYDDDNFVEDKRIYMILDTNFQDYVNGGRSVR